MSIYCVRLVDLDNWVQNVRRPSNLNCFFKQQQLPGIIYLCHEAGACWGHEANHDPRQLLLLDVNESLLHQIVNVSDWVINGRLGQAQERDQERDIKKELKREGLKRELKSDLNKAFKGQSLKKSEPCPLGACLNANFFFLWRSLSIFIMDGTEDKPQSISWTHYKWFVSWEQFSRWLEKIKHGGRLVVSKTNTFRQVNALFKVCNKRYK